MKPPAGIPPSWRPPMWWQSGLALRSLIRYLTQMGDGQPAYQQLIGDVYRRNISRPGTDEPADFENKFMDDTGWWGLAWLDAARYEVLVQRDFLAAARYLHLAERDASYIYSRPRTCGMSGIEFRTGYSPNTITNAEFVALAAQLAQIHRATGWFHDGRSAQAWLTEAPRTLNWLEGSGLVNMRAGTVASTDNRGCRPAGAAMTYTEGEVADALTQVGTASQNPAYYGQAAAFINRVLNPRHGMVAGNMLQEPCEAQPRLCAEHSYNITVASYRSTGRGGSRRGEHRYRQLPARKQPGWRRCSTGWARLRDRRADRATARGARLRMIDDHGQVIGRQDAVHLGS